MTREELQRLLDVTASHSVTIDVRDVPEAPGTVRLTTVYDGNSVAIEYESVDDYASGQGEGAGLKCVGNYEGFDAMVDDLEAFLGLAVAEWRNYSSEPVNVMVPGKIDYASNMAYFEQLVRERRVHLPAHARFEIAGIHWRHIDLYGEYRPDLLGEETRRSLAERGISDEDEDS